MRFNKTLLLCPKKYSIFNSFIETIKLFSDEVTGYDVKSEVSAGQLKFESQVFRFPNSIRSKWEKYFLEKINKLILNEFDRVNPDLVVVYNSEYLLPETCAIIKKKAKLIFFLGDSPFYTPSNNYNLTILQYADLVLAPDSFWLEQLNTLGIKNTGFFLLPIDSKNYFPIEKKDLTDNSPLADILYVGITYLNSWGYKKALLMSKFTGLDFKLYGNSAWERWFKYFPELKNNYNPSGYIKTEKLNEMFNRAKLIPVDGNPAIINGIHARAFEALGSGTLPLIEFRKDIVEKVFDGFGKDLPLIKDYSKAAEVATYYLKNDAERLDLALKMRDFVNQRYSTKNNADKIVDLLRSNQK